MEPITRTYGTPTWVAPYVKIRADSYVMLASLLGQPPSENLVRVLQDLRWNQAIPNRLDRALNALRQASRKYLLSDLEKEYAKLFVGLGCGEIVPYASWYREKTIQSAPLVSLRSDLIRLGIVRQTGSHESEDHAGALCECMALISKKPGEVDHATQAGFFRRHVAPWMATFFKDLEAAQSARFYRIVGIFGRHFIQSEIEYFKQNGGAH